MKLSTKETVPIWKCESCNLLFSDCTPAANDSCTGIWLVR